MMNAVLLSRLWMNSLMASMVSLILSYRTSSLTETYGYYDPATGRTLLPSDGTKLTFEDVIVFVVGGGNYSEYQHLQMYAKSQNPPRVVLYGSTDILSAKQVESRESLIDSFCLNFRHRMLSNMKDVALFVPLFLFWVNLCLHVF